LIALPKIELHLHLDCSLSFDAVRSLDPSVTLETYRREFIAPPKCASLADYLRYPPRSVALLQTSDALALAVDDLFEQLAADGVLYAEIRFAPFLHTAGGLAPWQVVETVDQAVSRAVARHAIEARLILCTLRHFDGQLSLQTARLLTDFQGSRVVGFDLAGDEAGYPLEPHLPAFDWVHAHGMSITAHAGEARGPASVWETLQKARPTRLGHGVRSIEDAQLVAHLAERRIHLEVCPTSNLQTGVSPDLPSHPIDRLYRQGVSLGLSTDTRTISDITLEQEYAKVARTFGWSAAEFLDCNLNAVAACFAPPELQEELRRRLVAGSPA
jgi:adenosine deaminase